VGFTHPKAQDEDYHEHNKLTHLDHGHSSTSAPYLKGWRKIMCRVKLNQKT
jgi:hypothetical protein